MKKLILVVFSIFILSSCRGGGGSSDSSQYIPLEKETPLSYYSPDYSPDSEFRKELFQNENGQNSDSSHLQPEPATAFLFGISLLGLAGYRLRRRK